LEIKEAAVLKIKITLLVSAILVLVAVIIYSGYQLYLIHQTNTQIAEMRDRLQAYRPTIQTMQAQQALPYRDLPNAVINQSIIDLQAKYPDVVGWLTIPDTLVDYPFVQATDNDYYLRRDLDGNSSQAGTLFMDYRNSQDFSDFNTPVFGHNMRNGSMFGTLQDIDLDNIGIIFLANAIYEIEFFAFAVIRPNDTIIYNPNIFTEAARTAFLDHIKSVARYFRDIGATPNDNFVVLSTCSYEFNNARMVLIGRVIK